MLRAVIRLLSEGDRGFGPLQEAGPAVGVWEIRHEPPLLHTGEGEPEPGKWGIMLPDGGVHFAEAEEAMASTLRPPLEVLLSPEVADEVFGQLPQDW
jgi:hypothetical protein